MDAFVAPKPAELSELIRNKALESGFTACGISSAELLEEPLRHFKHWLAEGMHADMAYLSREPEKRMDPTILVEGAKSVISLLYKYLPDPALVPGNTFSIARFALGLDYHVVLKNKMEELVQKIMPITGSFSYRLFTDSAPVAEKSWAAKSGLGWIGKNSLLINRESGSFLLICEIICDLELLPDKATYQPGCGNCTRCIDSCPTQAIYEAGKIDARKCLSYHTVETKTPVPEEFRAALGNKIYGCDICQEVCPYNKAIDYQQNSWLQPNPDLAKMTKEDWFNLSREEFGILFAKSGIKRLTYDGFMHKIRSVMLD